MKKPLKSAFMRVFFEVFTNYDLFLILKIGEEILEKDSNYRTEVHKAPKNTAKNRVLRGPFSK